MEELKITFASNLINLRNKANITQAELGEKLNYSDKSISKWERAEALPDVSVVMNIAEIFNVSVDYLLSPHDKKDIKPGSKPYSPAMILMVVMLGIFTVATLLFVIFWILGHTFWIIYVASIPVSLITLVILNSIWFDKKNNLPITFFIVLSIFLVIYTALIKYNPWQLFIVAIPAEAVVYFSFQIKKGFIPKKKQQFYSEES